MSQQEQSNPVVIIGAGPTGLGAAFRFEELNHKGIKQAGNWLLVDSAPNAGGLSRSVVDSSGFLWDMGGHVIFSHYQYFTDLLTKIVPQWNHLEREAWVWMRDTFVPYPFQQNIHRLPAEDVIKCVQGLIEIERNRASVSKPSNFKEWLIQSFGSGLCDVFMYPYNRKVWAYTPDKMNVQWMGERVATVDTNKIIANIILKRDELGWGPNSKFRFPLKGGTGAIYDALFNVLPKEKILFNKKVISIDSKDKIIFFSDGSRQAYSKIISTIPLDILCTITKNITFTTESILKEKASSFRYSSSHIIGFGLSGKAPPHLSSKCWLYFPEDNCPFYRATIFSNYSKYNVPKPDEQWSIMCEVSESLDKPVNINTIIKEVEEGLLNTKLIKEEDVNMIISRFHTRLEYGYPTPFLGRDELCEPLFNGFQSMDIFSRGRFGAWKYEISNQDHSLMQGVECVDHILLGSEETTFRYPSVVNSRNGAGRTPSFDHIKTSYDQMINNDNKP